MRHLVDTSDFLITYFEHIEGTTDESVTGPEFNPFGRQLKELFVNQFGDKVGDDERRVMVNRTHTIKDYLFPQYINRALKLACSRALERNATIDDMIPVFALLRHMAPSVEPKIITRYNEVLEEIADSFDEEPPYEVLMNLALPITAYRAAELDALFLPKRQSPFSVERFLRIALDVGTIEF